MWCLSILYTFTYPTILHWSINLPPGGLLGKIVFKYPLIYTLPIILQAERILLNIYHIINIYWGPILQEIMSCTIPVPVIVLYLYAMSIVPSFTSRV